ncbi:hypothetical protein GCM10023184_28970 [Flaviaesturariibacter amylovorans]|uniref:Secreted protein n=1 Tax=Flaviaesturariibacter amylovorans TaxID=1084520 RepID=A0ABP8H5P0_9BACT
MQVLIGCLQAALGLPATRDLAFQLHVCSLLKEFGQGPHQMVYSIARLIRAVAIRMKTLNWYIGTQKIRASRKCVVPHNTIKAAKYR